MKKLIVAPSKHQKGFVTLVTTANGVILAACGCGAPFASDYKFAKVPAREFAGKKANSRSFMAPQSSCDCGGTILKVKAKLSGDDFYYGSHDKVRSHHAKRRLLKQHRETIRGMVTA